jgi:hypothetical protein
VPSLSSALLRATLRQRERNFSPALPLSLLAGRRSSTSPRQACPSHFGNLTPGGNVSCPGGVT